MHAGLGLDTHEMVMRLVVVGVCGCGRLMVLRSSYFMPDWLLHAFTQQPAAAGQPPPPPPRRVTLLGLLPGCHAMDPLHDDACLPACG